MRNERVGKKRVTKLARVPEPGKALVIGDGEEPSGCDTQSLLEIVVMALVGGPEEEQLLVSAWKLYESPKQAAVKAASR